MRLWLTLVLITGLLAGCQTQRDRNATDMKSLQKTVGREQLIQTFSQITPPPMSKEIMNQSDEQIIAWIRQVDAWTHQVLSSPLTGEMDRHAMGEMRRHLEQVYTPEMAQRMIDYFFRHDYTLGTYQANSTKAMLGLRSEWREYELKKTQPAPDQYKVLLTGKTQFEYSESVMQHESAYRVQGDRLIVTEFQTRS
ncbi:MULTISPECIES: hypothetical protein [unclassified Paenibacillus]|uniref:hypothetical protein n=1 Tax=unclassified Paenibacillus TaxID=185978 RepID=UPI001AE654B3|nr:MULTISPECIES: hypothetical protein [unclassified Paenibacillus]MBP1157736.1 hypothetical protein [Paenibacillus sp. PvP091]MBP1171528.1 hypothetical protein [Paenibacillus sp. PvR098]MBP2442556.1 hypothetical protein [Paenibacillus sp. PvP052]